jgi:hypothetical protein
MVLDGKDVITIAVTGSGKSFPYWIPLLYIKYGITGATSYGHLKTNVSNKVEHNVPPNSPEAVYIQPRIPKRETRGFPDEHSRSRADEEPEPCHKDAVNKRHSSLNVEPKRKLTNLSVKP